MPAVAAAAVTGVSSFGGAVLAGSGTLYAATYVVASAAITYGMSVVTNELFGPDIPSFDENLSNRLDMRMDSNPPRRFIYGETRVSGPMSFARASKRTETGDTLEMLHYEVVIASHRIDSFQEIWLNEEKATLSTSSNDAWPDGDDAATDSEGYSRYKPLSTVYEDNVMLKLHRGTQTKADPDAVATSGIGGGGGRILSDVGYGIAYIYVAAKHDGEVFANGIPKISALVRGYDRVYDPRTGTYGYTDNPALCLADWMVTPRNLGGGGWDYDEIDEPALIAAANVCEEDLAVLDSGTTQQRYRIGGSFLATNSRGNIIKMFLDSMAGSMERVNGKWYIRAGKYTTPVVTMSEANWIEPLSMSFRTSLKDSVNAIRPILAGEFSEYQESDVATVKGEMVQDVTPDAAADSFSQPSVKMEDGYCVRFTIWTGLGFANENLPDEIKEEVYYFVVNSTDTTFQIATTRGGTAMPFSTFGSGTANCWWDKYLTEDQGRRRITDRKYMLVNDPEQARRLAFIELKRMRSEVTVTARSDLSAFNAIVGDIVTVNDTARGFSSKIFEVMRWGFGIQNGSLGCSLVLRAANDDDWDWDNGRVTATEPHESIVTKNLRDVDPPSALTVASGTDHLYQQGDGTIITRAYLSWTGSGSSLVSISGQYEIQFRKTVAAPDPVTNPENPWQIADFVHGSVTSYYLMQPQDGVDYDFRVRARTGLGFATDWVEVLAHTVLGKTELPNNVTGLTGSHDSSNYRVALEWTNPSDLDLRLIHVWLSIDGAAAIKLAAVPAGERGGTQRWVDTYVVSTTTSSQTWTYELETEDTTGNFSADPNPTVDVSVPAVETPTLPTIDPMTSFTASATAASTAGPRFTVNISHASGIAKIVYYPTSNPADTYVVELPRAMRSNVTVNCNVDETKYSISTPPQFTFKGYRGEYVSDSGSYWYSNELTDTATLQPYDGGLTEVSALSGTYVEGDVRAVVLRFLVPTFANLAKCIIYKDGEKIGEWASMGMNDGATLDQRKATFREDDVYPKSSGRTITYRVTTVDIYGTESTGVTEDVLISAIAFTLPGLSISTGTREVTFNWTALTGDDAEAPIAFQVLQSGNWKKQKLRYATGKDGGTNGGLTISDLDWTGATDIRIWRGYLINGRTVWSEESNPTGYEVGDIDPPSGFGIETDGSFGIRCYWSATGMTSLDWVAIQRWPASSSGDTVQEELQDVKWVKASLGEYKERIDWTGWVGAVAWKVQDLNGKQFKSGPTSAVYVSISEFSAPATVSLSTGGTVTWTVNEEYPFVRLDIENVTTNTIYTPRILPMTASPYYANLPQVGDTFQVWVSYAESARVYGASATDTATLSSPV